MRGITARTGLTYQRKMIHLHYSRRVHMHRSVLFWPRRESVRRRILLYRSAVHNQPSALVAANRIKTLRWWAEILRVPIFCGYRATSQPIYPIRNLASGTVLQGVGGLGHLRIQFSTLPLQRFSKFPNPNAGVRNLKPLLVRSWTPFGRQSKERRVARVRKLL